MFLPFGWTSFITYSCDKLFFAHWDCTKCINSYSKQSIENKFFFENLFHTAMFAFIGKISCLMDWKTSRNRSWLKNNRSYLCNCNNLGIAIILTWWFSFGSYREEKIVVWSGKERKRLFQSFPLNHRLSRNLISIYTNDAPLTTTHKRKKKKKKKRRRRRKTFSSFSLRRPLTTFSFSLVCRSSLNLDRSKKKMNIQ